jgi:hypothetical protein
MGKFIAVVGGLIAMAGGLALVVFSATFRAAFFAVVL